MAFEANFDSSEDQTLVVIILSRGIQFEYIFTTGGIGPTHDDITADCIAEAFGVSLRINDEAKKILEKALKLAIDQNHDDPKNEILALLEHFKH